MPVTILLKALGYTPEQILAQFFVFDAFTSARAGSNSRSCPNACAAISPNLDIADKKGKVIVAKDKRITVKHIRDMEAWLEENRRAR